ncbi:Membrane metallo-endopeptidase-like 1 [Armadillidium vulgare]|nr:Membrane metallo-endopeptidase-like 1 [Armadillidium vulgare]
MEHWHQMDPESMKFYRYYLFKNISQTRVLGNYMIKHVVATSVSYLSQEIRDAELQYSKKIFGIGKEAPRWKECMDMVSEELTYAVGSLYVRHFFNEDAKAKAEEMVYYIRKAFDRNLETVDWMDEKTKARAIKKAKAIKSLIGYPKEIMDEEVLKEYHKGLVISEGELLSNMINITRFKRSYVVSHLRKKVIKADWKIYGGAAIVNAFYSSMDNAIRKNVFKI